MADPTMTISVKLSDEDVAMIKREVQKRVIELEAENERLRDGLAELADKKNYYSENMPPTLWGGSHWQQCTTPDKFAAWVLRGEKDDE